MCNCRKGVAATKWEVVYPDGRTEEKSSAAAARIAAARVDGATARKVA